MNSKNSKMLFMLIDKIDERYIDEAWGGDNEAYGDIDFDIDYDIDYESGRRRGVNVVIEHKPFRVFTPAIVTAACMLLFVAGGFTAVNIFRGELLAPGSRVDNPASYIESIQSSDSSEDFSIPQDEISHIEEHSNYDLHLSVLPGKSANTEATEKMNNRGYAEIVIGETNATEEHPILARILRSQPKGGIEPISNPIYITGTGTYRIEYTALRGAGSYSYLYLEYPINDFDGSDTISERVIVGTWSP